MPSPPAPKARRSYLDGRAYARLVDPLTAGMHRLVAQAVPPDSRVLDACCGTGAFAMRVAARCSEVVGADISAVMVRQAERTRLERGLDNVRFEVADLGRRTAFADRYFDVATVLMALHEMPHATRSAVLSELLRVARSVIAVDFAVPMHWNLQGIRNRLMEVAAGPRHLGQFLDFGRRGGLPPLLEAAGACIVRQGRIDAGNLLICTVERRATSGSG